MDAAVLLTEIPGVISALLEDVGIYVLRFDPTRLTRDDLLATMDREGLELIAWDDLEGDADIQRVAEALVDDG